MMLGLYAFGWLGIIVGKEGNDGYQQFLVFHNVFKSFLSSLPNDKILGLIKLKAFADDKINVP